MGREAQFAVGGSSPWPDDRRRSSLIVPAYVSSPLHIGPVCDERACAAMSGMCPRL